MANIKSAKKRILTSQVRAERNKAARSEVKTYMKNVFAAVEAGDKEGYRSALTKHLGRVIGDIEQMSALAPELFDMG